MAFSINTYTSLITSGSQAMFALKEALSASNWKVSGSSDGYVYSPDGDILTGAIDLENNSAWFTLVAPDDTHQWSFQRKTTNEDWTVNRSKAGMSGSVDPTTPPLDGEAVTIIDGTLFNTSIGNWLVSVVIDDGSPPTATSSFYAFNVPNGGGEVYTILFDEPLLPNTYDVLDQDPYISAAGYYSTGFDLPWGFQSGPQGYSLVMFKRVRHNMSSPENRVSFFTGYFDEEHNSPYCPPANSDINSCITLSPYTGKELLMPAGYHKIRWYQPSNYHFFWGFSNYIKYATIPTRQNGETLDASPYYYIFCSGLWLPWDASTPSI